MRTKEKGNFLVPPKGSFYSWVILLSLCVVIGSFLIHEIFELDVWWHIPIGKDIIQTLKVPSLDHYSKAGEGRPYHDSHWLFQLGLVLFHSRAGWVGVEALTVLLWTLTLLGCFKAVRTSLPLIPSCILLFLTAMASVERFLPRPETITFLMISLFYLLLQNANYRSYKTLALFGFLQMVWTNSHGLFVLGPFMIGCYWVHELAAKLRGGPHEFKPLSRLLAVVLPATFITPYGWKGWRYAYLLFTEAGAGAPEVMKAVGELSPTFGKQFMTSPAFWFFLVLLLLTLITVVAGIMKKISFPLHRCMITAGFAAMACTGRRNVVLFVLVAAPFIAEMVKSLLPFSLLSSRLLALVASAGMLLYAAFPLSGNYYLYMELPSRFGGGVTPSFFPYALPDFLKKIDFKGQVFNSNPLGGFYLFHHYPRQKPLTDGRWEVYDPYTLDLIRKAPTDARLWAKIVDNYSIEGVLLDHTSAEARGLIPFLRKGQQWKLVYFDHAASFWVPADKYAGCPAIDLDVNGKLPSPPKRLDDCLILDTFLSLAGAPKLRLQNLEQAVALGLKREDFLEAYGMLQIQFGKIEESEKTFQRLLKQNPQNTTALNELSFHAYRRGDLLTAQKLLHRALQLDPTNKDFQANYDRIQILLSQQQPSGSGVPR